MSEDHHCKNQDERGEGEGERLSVPSPFSPSLSPPGLLPPLNSPLYPPPPLLPPESPLSPSEPVQEYESPKDRVHGRQVGVVEGEGEGVGAIWTLD